MYSCHVTAIPLSNRLIEITMMMSHWHHQGSFLKLQYFSSPFRAGFSSLTTRSKLFFMCKTFFSHNKATEVDKSKIRSVSQPVRIFLKQISIALSYYQIIFVFVPMFIHLHRFYLAVVHFSLHESYTCLSARGANPLTPAANWDLSFICWCVCLPANTRGELGNVDWMVEEH